MKKININTISYWDNRFRSGDWEEKKGRLQNAYFAMEQIKHIDISREFDGSILDFGCALGDAIPIYQNHYRKAKFIGLDHSEAAIESCKSKYGKIAEYICRDVDSVPDVDVIIASNVMEHISNEEEVLCKLIKKCFELYIIVPYKESPLCSEHINYYDLTSYSKYFPFQKKVFCSRGWSQYGINLFKNVYFKNILRFCCNKKLVTRKKQIMFHFKNYN